MLNFKFNLKGTLKLILYNLLFIGTLFFAYKNIQWNKLNTSELNINYFYLALTTIFFTLFYLCLGFGWQKVLSLYSPVNKKPVYLTYLASQIFKYLPSSLFIFSFQALFTRNMEFKIKKITPALFMQFGLVLLTALIVFLIFSVWVMYGISLLILLFIAIFSISKKYLKLQKIPVMGELVKFNNTNLTTTLTFIILLYLSSWMFAGISLHCLSIGSGSRSSLADTISIQSASFFGSILAVFAPGGLGVREYILSLSSLSLNTIIIWRIFTTVYDFLLSGVSLLLIRRYERSVSKEK